MASDDTVSNSVKDSVASNATVGGSKKAIIVEVPSPDLDACGFTATLGNKLFL